jgi:hypothetical protein
VKAKPIIPRELARRDVEVAVDFYQSEAGEQVALGLSMPWSRRISRSLPRRPAVHHAMGMS